MRQLSIVIFAFSPLWRINCAERGDISDENCIDYTVRLEGGMAKGGM